MSNFWHAHFFANYLYLEHSKKKKENPERAKQSYRNNKMKKILVHAGKVAVAPILPQKRPLNEAGKKSRKKAKVIKSIPKKLKKKKKIPKGN